MITQPELDSNSLSRDFKGIWIPREIWLAKGLLPLEKMLWAEIHSLYDRQRKGCYAPNSYLARFFGVSERYIREMIAKLRKFGFIRDVSFDGRTRVFMAVMPPEDFEPEEDSEEIPEESDEFQADRNSGSGQGGTVVPGRQDPQFQPSYIEGIDKGIYTPSTPSSAGAESSAVADGECVNSKKSSASKKKTQEFPPEVHKVADQLIAVMQQHSKTFRPPAKPVFQEAAALLLEQKQDIAYTLRVLDWACRDKTIKGEWRGWAKNVYSAPSSKKGEHGITKFCTCWLSQIDEAMKAKHDCKLTPGADLSSCDEAIAEWKARSL